MSNLCFHSSSVQSPVHHRLIKDLSSSDDIYFSAVRRFYIWCKQNFLDLNVLKTKEMLIDFRENPPPVPYLEIDDKIVERVEKYKYLGTVIDGSLAFNQNVDAIHRKCQPRLYCLHKLRNIGIVSKIFKRVISAPLSPCSQFRSCAGMEVCVFEANVYWAMWWMYVVNLWVRNRWECKICTNDEL